MKFIEVLDIEGKTYLINVKNISCIKSEAGISRVSLFSGADLMIQGSYNLLRERLDSLISGPTSTLRESSFIQQRVDQTFGSPELRGRD